MRLSGYRRAGLASAVVALVLAAVMVFVATVALPLPHASAIDRSWIDTTFGAQGIALLGDPLAGHEFTVDAADRIYAATSVDGPGTSLQRLTADGAVDLSFAGGGLTVSGQPDELHADAGGTVTLARRVFNGNGSVLSRFTTTGAPDLTFGGGSVSILDGFQSSQLSVVGLLDRAGGGLLAVVGTNIQAEPTKLVALTSTGALDPTWAPGAPQPGVLTLPIVVRGVAADGDSAVLLASDSTISPPPVFLMRFDPTGAQDTGFGPAGRAPLPPFTQFTPTGLIASGGAYYVKGGKLNPSGTLPAVIKVQTTGTLDPNFGAGGIATGPANGCNRVGSALVVTTAHVFLAGQHNAVAACGGQPALVIDRFTPAGQIDNAFGVVGELSLPLGPDRVPGGLLGMEVQSTGRPLVFAGGGPHRAAAFRLLDEEGPPAAGSYVAALHPARILDTRTGAAVPAGGSVDLVVTGIGDVPADGVGAVVLNVTVTQPAADGNVVVFPTGAAVPLASNVNFVPGQTIPNLVTVKVGDGGKVTLRNNSSGTVHLVADEFGYYRAGVATLPGTFTPLTPDRILDTRTGNGAPAGAVAAGGAIDLQVTGRGGVPATGVSAVVMNVTATQPSWDGSVVVFPAGSPAPLASNLNFVPGQTIPNLVTVPVGSGGQVTLKNNSIGTVHLVADVAGYYLAGTPVASGAFVPMAPVRLLDTRNGPGPIGPVAAGGTVDVPASLVASRPGPLVLNVTVTRPTWDGSVVAYPAGAAAPFASNLNFVPGQTIPNLVIVVSGSGGRVTLRNNSITGTLHLVVDISGYFLS